MNDIRKYKLEITYTTPFLQEKYVGKVDETGKSKDYSQEWKDQTYLDAEGFVVLTEEMFKACLQQGSKGLHRGKVFMSKLVPAGLIVNAMDSRVLVNGKPITLETIEEKQWLQVYRKVIGGKSNPATRTQIPAGATVEWEILVRDTQLTENDVEKVITNAGIYAGTGGQRPSSPKKPGKYGQFKITKFEKVN